MVVKALMRGWAERGGAVLVTSHLLEIVERICDRLGILVAGRTLAVGTPAELRARAGGVGTLEEAFRSLTRAEDPSEIAREIMGAS